MTNSTGELLSGDVLDGRFQILELISQSGGNSVFKAIDTLTGRPVVVKVPPRRAGTDAPYLREAQIGRQLDHQGLLKFLAIDERAKSRPYLVTEFLEGHTLHDAMHALRVWPVEHVLRRGAEICDALDYLHRHDIIHADVKPGNIMLCPDGSCRVIDFGIARFASAGGFPAHVGTPEYMAPEQVKGKRGDARTDLYALGAVLYEMITGHVPFDEQPEDHRLHARLVGDPVAPSRYVPGLSPHVEEIVLHALARKPADRYVSAAAMKEDLEAPARVAVTGRASRLQAPLRAKLWLQYAGLASLLLLVPVLLFFVFLALLRK